MSILDILEKPTSNSDPEFTRYFYRGYGIGWLDEYVPDQESTRMYNRVCAIPATLNYEEEEREIVLDYNRIGKSNCYIVCPVGGRIQTYSLGGKWDNTYIDSGIKIYKESSNDERYFAILETVRKVTQFIDLNM